VTQLDVLYIAIAVGVALQTLKELPGHPLYHKIIVGIILGSIWPLFLGGILVRMDVFLVRMSKP